MPRIAGTFRVIGPNTSGIFNAHRGLNLVGFSDLRKGAIGIVSQSGNVALALVTEGHLNSHVGFSTYIGVGNESDLRFHDYLSHLGADPDTGAIAMYVESFKEPIAFLEAASDVARRKPRVSCAREQDSYWTEGRTIAHRQHGRQLRRRQGVPARRGCRAGRALGCAAAGRRESLSLLPAMRSRRVAVLADGGGHATLAADALGLAGLSLPELGAATRARLAAVLTLQGW